MPKPNGPRIRQLREERGLSTTELANRVGFTNPGSMRNIEGRSDPTAKPKLHLIARELGVSVDDIITKNTKPQHGAQPELT